MARQPIFDRELKVVGYELLFRDGSENRAVVVDHEAATATVLLNALTEIGLQRIVGAQPAWINVCKEFMREDRTGMLPAGVVLEILEGQIIDAQMITAVANLKRRGNKLALDDFSYTPDIEPLLALVDVVKLDLLAFGREQLCSDVERLRGYGVRLLAEKVETQEDYAFCAEAGCDLFQGYFFCRPETLYSRRIDANRLVVLRLLAALYDSTVQLDELARQIALDVGLSVRLLRYINSAFFGLRQPVRSIAQAAALLGVEQLRRWAALTLFASIDGKPAEPTITALVRARFCELAAAHQPDARSAEMFTLGLFSVIDALLDTPIAEALAGIPLASDIRDALIGHSGRGGQLLLCAIAIETADFDHAQQILPTAGQTYLSALTWAQSAAESILGCAG